MSQENIVAQNQTIILTTGIYDLIKDHIRRKKVNALQENLLKLQLKYATQVPRRNLPSNVVSIDTRVTVKDYYSDREDTYTFVAPAKAKMKNNTLSILSPMGLALVGFKEGDIVSWVFDDRVRQMEILKVERLD